MITLIAPGDPVFVSGMSGGPATVVKQNGPSVRVRMTSTGKARTVDIDRLSVKPVAKSLTVGMASRSDEKRRAVLRGDDLILVGGGAREAFPLRPVPKPVTLTNPAYLAYVRKHPCCLCGRSEGIEAHHWSHHGGVMGAKVDDYRTVPLCQEHHRYWHDHGTLPGRSRDMSEAVFVCAQRSLLSEWGINIIDEGDMVDALIRAIGGADA